jgi:hypothetical protein
MKKPSRTSGNLKRERRIAPKYRFKWGDDILPAVKQMSAPEVTELREDECYTRIEDAESARNGENAALSVYAMEGFCANQPWWAPFDFGEHRFQLDYKDGAIREYVLVFARAPTIPPSSEIWEPSLKALLPSNDKSKKRGRRGARGALAAAGKKHPKQTDDKREFTTLHMFVETLAAVAEELNRSRTELQRAIRPKLLRSVVHMKRARAGMVNSANEAATILVRMSQKSASLVSNVLSSLTRARDVAAQSFGPEASLEPRCVGHNTGLRILIYSWNRNDEPADAALPWPASWFGSIEWPVSWFGPLPEEERAFV